MADPARIPDPAVRALTRQLVDMQDRIRRLELGQRATQLGHSSVEGGFLRFNDSGGVGRLFVGKQPDGKFGWGAVNGEPPPRPNTPQLTASMAGISVFWNGDFAGPTPSDFSYVDVHYSPVGAGFIPGDSNLAGQLFGAGTLPIAPLDTSTAYWVKLVAYNSSGVPSEASFPAGPVTPAQVVAQAILDGIVGELQLADDAVTRAKVATGAIGTTEIADGSISTPKVQARAIDANLIAVATILAEHLTADLIDTEHLRALAVTADKIAANAIEAGHITAGAVDADKLAAVLILASKIVAGDPDGWRLELGDAQTPILWWDGTSTGFAVSKDVITGSSNVYVSGRVEFGSGSQIDADFLDLSEQPASGFQDPRPRQNRNWTQSAASTVLDPRWVSATQPGNLLLMSVYVVAASGATPPTITMPAGWVQAATVTLGGSRLSLYQTPAAATSHTTEHITTNIAVHWATGLFEYQGFVSSPLDVTATATGTSATADTGTTGVATQAEDMQFAVWASPSVGYTNGSGRFTNPTNGFMTVQESEGVFGHGFAAATKVVASTIAASSQISLSSTQPWLGIIASFKRAVAAATPPQPPPATVRLFSRETGGSAVPHVLDDDARIYPVGRVPHCSVRLTASYGSLVDTDVWAQSDWAAGDDPYGMVSISTSAGTYSNITIPVSGLYLVVFKAIFAANGEAPPQYNAACFVAKNARAGASSVARDNRRFNRYGSGDHSPVEAIRAVPLTAGDILYWGTWSPIATTVHWAVPPPPDTPWSTVPTEITATFLSPL